MDHEINYSKNILITLGCSWTFGVGAGYEPGMRRRDFDKISYDPNICNEWMIIINYYLLYDHNYDFIIFIFMIYIIKRPSWRLFYYL